MLVFMILRAIISNFSAKKSGARKNKDETEVKSVAPSRGVATSPTAGRPSDSSASTTQHHVAIPPQSHHFSFSIDLRSVKSLDSNTTQNVFLR